MSSVLFCDFMQCSGNSTPVLGQPIISIFNDQAVRHCLTVCPLKMGPKGCPETSVRNYHSALHKIAEECRPNEKLTDMFYLMTLSTAKIVCIRGTRMKQKHETLVK